MAKPPARTPAMSGAQVYGVVTVLEAFVVALVSAEAPTRPDPAKFIKDLKSAAIEAAKTFGHPEVLAYAGPYTDELIQAISKSSGIPMPADGEH